MRKLDRYVAREFLGPFFAAITAFIVISLSVQLFWLAEMVVVKHTPLATVLKLILYNIPTALVQVLPFATLFAVLLGLGRLSRDSELSIMRAAGLRLSRIAAPMIFIALLISAFGFYMGDQVAPKANLESRNIVNRMILGDSIPGIENNVFFRGPDNKFFYIGRVSEDRATVQDIMIYDIGYGKYPQLITAAKGQADSGVWVFLDGNIHECGSDGRVVSTAHFDSLEIRMERAVTDYTNSGRTTSEMSMKQLKESISLFTKSGIKAKNLLIDYYLKIAQPISSLIFAILAVPLAVRSPRRGGAVYSIAAGILIVTLYFIFESVIRSYGMLQATRLQPWMAAWSADIIFMVVALILLIRADSKRMRKRIRKPKGPATAIILLIALAFLLQPSIAAAAGTNVKVTAERLVYEGSDIWRAEGKVEVSFDDVVVRADTARIDLTTNKAELTGSVTVEMKGSVISSGLAIVDIKTKEVSFGAFEGRVSDERVEGYIYINGAGFTEKDGDYKLTDGYLTTCDLPQPHYRIEAKSIEFTEADVIVAKDVSYFEGNIRLLRLPSLTIPLREEDRIILPEFGWSGIDGAYIKTTMKRQLNEDNRLTLRLDFFFISGLGLGLKHEYGIEGKGNGYYSLYVLKSLMNPASDWTAEISQTLKLPLDIIATGKYSYRNTTNASLAKSEEHFAELKLNRSVEDDKTALAASYRYKDAAADTSTLNLSASHSMTLLEDIKLSGSVSYRRTEINDALNFESMTYKATLSHQTEQGRLTLNVQASETMNDSQEVVVASLKRLPELQIELFKMPIGKLPLNIGVKLTAGRYVERILNTDPIEFMDAGKGEADISLAIDRVDLWGFATYDLAGTFIGSLYSTGDSRAYLGVATSLNVTPIKGWGIKLSYDYMKGFGASPYRFDALNEKNKIALSTSASFYGFTASASSGYDFLKWKYDSLSAGLGYKFEDKYQADVTAKLSLPDFGIQTIVGRLTISPIEEVSLKFGLEYNGSLNKISKIETSGSLSILKEWKVGWAVIYDVAREGLRKADFALTKDLHCREITAGYQVVDKRFFVNFKFKAFPDMPIGIGSDDWSLFN